MLIIIASASFTTVRAAFLLRKELRSRGLLSNYNRNARSDARLQRGLTTRPHL